MGLDDDEEENWTTSFIVACKFTNWIFCVIKFFRLFVMRFYSTTTILYASFYGRGKGQEEGRY